MDHSRKRCPLPGKPVDTEEPAGASIRVQNAYRVKSIGDFVVGESSRIDMNAGKLPCHGGHPGLRINDVKRTELSARACANSRGIKGRRRLRVRSPGHRPEQETQRDEKKTAPQRRAANRIS